MTTTIDLSTIHLAKGGHRSPSEGACLLEAASMFAAEPFGDTPQCVSPLLREAGIALNDCITDQDERDALKDLIPIIVTTAGDGLDPQRAAMAWAFYVNRWVPAFLRLVPDLVADAEMLESLDTADEAATMAALDAARMKASAAWSAAWSAAEIAAWSAAESVLQETSDRLRAEVTALYREMATLTAD